MGTGNFTVQDWTSYAATNVNNKSTEEIYTASTMDSEFDPKGVMRESRDSDDHPNSTPIIIGLDVTGSMSAILQAVATQLGDLVLQILDRKPVDDPQIMFNAIGDARCGDKYPLQCTQFESDIRIAEQLTQLFFEEGGGGNGFESYPLTWYFAANHTSIDSFEKRNKKGFIFTMGDDSYPEVLTRDEIKRIFGEDIEKDSLPISEVLSQVNRKYEVFHLCLKEGWNMAHGWSPNSSEKVIASWKAILGERAIPVSDYRKVPQIIVSILESMAGKSLDDIVASWDGSTGIVVREALAGLTTKTANSELVEF